MKREKPGKLKLSDLIEAGAKLGGPQARGTLFERDERGNVVGACALGKANLAYRLLKKGKKNLDLFLSPRGERMIEDILPRDLGENASCCGSLAARVLVVTMNDSERRPLPYIVKRLRKLGF